MEGPPILASITPSHAVYSTGATATEAAPTPAPPRGRGRRWDYRHRDDDWHPGDIPPRHAFGGPNVHVCAGGPPEPKADDPPGGAPNSSYQPMERPRELVEMQVRQSQKAASLLPLGLTDPQPAAPREPARIPVGDGPVREEREDMTETKYAPGGGIFFPDPKAHPGVHAWIMAHGKNLLAHCYMRASPPTDGDVAGVQKWLTKSESLSGWLCPQKMNLDAPAFYNTQTVTAPVVFYSSLDNPLVPSEYFLARASTIKQAEKECARLCLQYLYSNHTPDRPSFFFSDGMRKLGAELFPTELEPLRQFTKSAPRGLPAPLLALNAAPSRPGPPRLDFDKLLLLCPRCEGVVSWARYLKVIRLNGRPVLALRHDAVHSGDVEIKTNPCSNTSEVVCARLRHCDGRLANLRYTLPRQGVSHDEQPRQTCLLDPAVQARDGAAQHVSQGAILDHLTALCGDRMEDLRLATPEEVKKLPPKDPYTSRRHGAEN
ncbi:hypothetical protein PAPYR_6090 [Paratrimastix pyriformis]|uniref:Uncharacterized protein n=1 Tax=Paratrimastix pyriformis TaxID=342808 RepID=A0ABQ8ULQ1_9EUKA|nr:hypothetical protein PAPYR_6090 [Paratrimastix pyriformis]